MGKTPFEIFDALRRMITNPEGTEARMVADLLEDHISNSETDHGVIPAEALDLFDTMLEELMVATMSVRRTFNALRDHPGDKCPIPFCLCSAAGDNTVLDGRIEVTTDGIEIGFKGYGTRETDAGAPLFIEQQNGIARAFAWAEINSANATHCIGLGGAQEKFRRDDNVTPTTE